jgi:hypothetical protein
VRTMRGGRGLGDTIYLQSIAAEFVKDGHPICVASDYPEVFTPLGRKVRVIAFTRVGITILAHYSMRKGAEGTTQFQDMCLAAGFRRGVDLRLDWKVADQAIVDRVQAAGRPVVCVQLPRAPMGRTDGFGAEVLPNCERIQEAIDMIGDRATLVLLGSGRALYNFSGIDIDLTGKTSVSQLLDVASVSAGFVGYPSFFVPLAESFNRRSLIFWSTAGLRSAQPFISSITPAKVLHKKTSRAILDTASEGEISDAVESLLRP